MIAKLKELEEARDTWMEVGEAEEEQRAQKALDKYVEDEMLLLINQIEKLNHTHTHTYIKNYVHFIDHFGSCMTRSFPHTHMLACLRFAPQHAYSVVNFHTRNPFARVRVCVCVFLYVLSFFL